jgi:hypothetical protein
MSVNLLIIENFNYQRLVKYERKGAILTQIFKALQWYLLRLVWSCHFVKNIYLCWNHFILNLTFYTFLIIETILVDLHDWWIFNLRIPVSLATFQPTSEFDATHCIKTHHRSIMWKYVKPVETEFCYTYPNSSST